MARVLVSRRSLRAASGGHLPDRWPCVSRVRLGRLHERRWRDKLGLFFVEGEDAVAAATAEPVDVLVAGEDVEPRLLAEVSTAGASAARDRRLPPRRSAGPRRSAP